MNLSYHLMETFQWHGMLDIILCEINQNIHHNKQVLFWSSNQTTGLELIFLGFFTVDKSSSEIEPQLVTNR